MKNNFVDHVIMYLKSGNGGDGVVRWRREKFSPHGGPDGGDGGKGGSIILKGNKQLWTLLDLRYRKFIKAEHGAAGSGAKKTGKDAEDIILNVPLGTVIYDADSDELLGEINEDGEELVIAPGGRGGEGNFQFRSATNQAPDYATKGKMGIEIKIILELKILADVGLVGFPNAGKSTLLSVVTAAKPEIADYPFTTLVPNLGIVKYKDYNTFVMADIPGIIEGAHLGKGLGTQFLRHIERNPLLLFMVPADSEDIKKELKVLKNELKLYDLTLTLKKSLFIITKCDLLTESEIKKLKKKFPDAFLISSATGLGIDTLLDALWLNVSQNNKENKPFEGE